LDRALVVTLDPIDDGQRRSETALETDFAAARAGILSVLLDAVSTALANEATTSLDSLPRMTSQPPLDCPAGTTDHTRVRS
jgi:hypothetical protein